MELVRPGLVHLPSYIAALEAGWSPDNLRGAVAAQEELKRITEDANAFLASLDDREGKRPPVTLPDGTKVARLPGFRRWMWDGEFCGTINFRWQPGTPELPPHCFGHVGYGVVPWKRGQGYATKALGFMVTEAKQVGLPYLEVTTDIDNLLSQRVILKCGGVLHEQFCKPARYGGKLTLRYRIPLGA